MRSPELAAVNAIQAILDGLPSQSSRRFVVYTMSVDEASPGGGFGCVRYWRRRGNGPWELLPRRKRRNPSSTKPLSKKNLDVGSTLISRAPDAYDLKGDPIFLKPEKKRRGRPPKQRLDGGTR